MSIKNLRVECVAFETIKLGNNWAIRLLLFDKIRKLSLDSELLLTLNKETRADLIIQIRESIKRDGLIIFDIQPRYISGFVTQMDVITLSINKIKANDNVIIIASAMLETNRNSFE